MHTRLHRGLAAAAVALGLVTSLTGCQLATETVAWITAGSETGAGGALTHTEPIEAQVVRVIDGDTIAVSPTADLPATNDRGTEHSLRLLGLDAPEMNKMSDKPADCGAEAATAHLEALVSGQTVMLTFDSRSDHTDRYGRSLAYVERAGADIALQMVEAGLAEAWYPYGEPEPERFGTYSAAAQTAAAAGTGSHGTCDTIGR